MLTALFKNWTQFTVSIPHDDNLYTENTSSKDDNM